MSLKQKSEKSHDSSIFNDKLEKAHENKKKHSFLKFLAGTALVFTAFYTVYSVIRDNISIRENNQRIEELNLEIKQVQEENEQINGYLENKDNLNEYIENIAREKLDYANADERIFYIVPAAE